VQVRIRGRFLYNSNHMRVFYTIHNAYLALPRLILSGEPGEVGLGGLQNGDDPIRSVRLLPFELGSLSGLEQGGIVTLLMMIFGDDDDDHFPQKIGVTSEQLQNNL
jgi:hypothetical protein